MREIIFREGYKLFHSKRQCFLIIVLLGITLLMFSASVGWKHEMVYILLDETEEEREFFSQDGHMAQDIYDLIGYGQEDHTAGNGRYFWMTPKALELFRAGGELYEKYQEYRFPERMILQQMIGGEIASPEQKDFETKWRFFWMLADPSAAYFTAVVFTAFFFGRDFVVHGYHGIVFAGQKREKIFWGKYMIFTFLMLCLFIVELGLAIVVFIPQICLLPISYIIRGLLLRSLCDTGIAMLCVVFSFLGKSEWKAIGLSGFFMLVFIIRRSRININPYQFITDAFWESCSSFNLIFQIGVVTAIIFVISGLFSARLFQQSELK